MYNYVTYRTYFIREFVHLFLKKYTDLRMFNLYKVQSMYAITSKSSVYQKLISLQEIKIISNVSHVNLTYNWIVLNYTFSNNKAYTLTNNNLIASNRIARNYFRT